MNTSITLRLTAAAASLCTTFVLFSMVASLAEPTQPRAGLQLAQAQAPVTR
jgi:hypothetical protein